MKLVLLHKARGVFLVSEHLVEAKPRAYRYISVHAMHGLDPRTHEMVGIVQREQGSNVLPLIQRSNDATMQCTRANRTALSYLQKLLKHFRRKASHFPNSSWRFDDWRVFQDMSNMSRVIQTQQQLLHSVLVWSRPCVAVTCLRAMTANNNNNTTHECLPRLWHKHPSKFLTNKIWHNCSTVPWRVGAQAVVSPGSAGPVSIEATAEYHSAAVWLRPLRWSPGLVLVCHWRCQLAT